MRIFTRELYNQLQEDDDSLYTTHHIRKGNGRGYRRIDEPAPALKARQRLALKVMNRRHRDFLHWRACGCVPRLDLRPRILEHVGWAWALTTDIKDFYPTVTWEKLCEVEALQQFMDHEDLRCCCKEINGELVLPQGAPTSPMLANAVMTQFDAELEIWLTDWEDRSLPFDAFANAIVPRTLYSRYMDDILVSINCETKAEAEQIKQSVLQRIIDYGFQPNRRKTKLRPYSQKQKWIGFNLVMSDITSGKPHVDKRYVYSVIEEGIDIVLLGTDPMEDESWRGKLEYIRYNNPSRFWRVKRKIALELYIAGLVVPGVYRGTGVIGRFLERMGVNGRTVVREGSEVFEEYIPYDDRSISSISNTTISSSSAGIYSHGQGFAVGYVGEPGI